MKISYPSTNPIDPKMIIDIHAHIAYANLYPASYLNGMIHMGDQDGKTRFSALLPLLLKDKTCEKLIAQMDQAGIDKTVLLIIDAGIGLNEPAMSLEEIFLLHYEVLQKYPDRFIVFAGVDPRRGIKGYKLLRRSITRYGFKGLKLYPPMGYSMDDKRLYDYYRLCDDNDLSVLIHTGPSLGILKNELADPRHICKVAADFPNINFILAHAGYNLFHPSVRATLNLSNVFFDIAGFQTIYKKSGDPVPAVLNAIFTEEMNRKVIFGTDWPLFNLLSPLAHQITSIVELYRQAPDRTADALDNILSHNAMRALKIAY